MLGQTLIADGEGNSGLLNQHPLRLCLWYDAYWSYVVRPCRISSMYDSELMVRIREECEWVVIHGSTWIYYSVPKRSQQCGKESHSVQK